MMEQVNSSKRQQLIMRVYQGLGLAWMIGFIMGFIITCILPVFQQIKTWLKTGIFPEKDLYWFFADVSCAATNFQAAGFQGMDLCRPNYIEFTDWVGVNKIINWIFDLHIGVVFLLLSLFVFWIVFQVLEEISQKGDITNG